MLSQIGVGTTVLFIIISFFVLGLGLGALFGGDNLIVQESVAKEESGIALSTVQVFQSLGATIGLSIFGSLLARNIGSGVENLKDQLPAGTADHIMTGGIPSGLAPELLGQVKMAFADSFQNIFSISLFFVVAAFVICWFLKKEVLSKKEPETTSALQTSA
jgi:fucose permease